MEDDRYKYVEWVDIFWTACETSKLSLDYLNIYLDMQVWSAWENLDFSKFLQVINILLLLETLWIDAKNFVWKVKWSLNIIVESKLKYVISESWRVSGFMYGKRQKNLVTSHQTYCAYSCILYFKRTLI